MTPKNCPHNVHIPLTPSATCRMRGWVCLLFLCMGCAIGHVDHGGGLTGLALGHAKIERCVAIDPPPYVEHPKQEVCSEISGGVVSQGWAGVLSALISAAGAAFALYLAH